MCCLAGCSKSSAPSGTGSGPSGSDGGCSADGGSPPCPPTCNITSETFATAPANRARTKVGVGEEVTLKFSLGNASWSTIAGRLSSLSGASVVFTAPDRAASVTVTATGSGCTATITFTVVEPSSVRMRRYPGTGVKHTVHRPDVGIRTEIYLLPDDVCFYNVSYHEVDVHAVCSGVYSPFTGLGHDPHPATLGMSMTVIAGLGTKANAMDSVYSGDPGTLPPFPPGSEVYDIPYEFKVGAGPWKQFATVRHDCSLATDGVTLTVTKAGATGTVRVGDSSSSF